MIYFALKTMQKHKVLFLEMPASRSLHC